MSAIVQTLVDGTKKLLNPGRVCTTTGLSVCRTAQQFIKLNAVSAIVFLLVGGVAALLLALTRWQTVHLLNISTPQL